MHFLPVFELMSDSLTATKVETNQCPLHQSILLTQGPIHENQKNKTTKPRIHQSTNLKCCKMFFKVRNNTPLKRGFKRHSGLYASL